MAKLIAFSCIIGTHKHNSQSLIRLLLAMRERVCVNDKLTTRKLENNNVETDLWKREREREQGSAKCVCTREDSNLIRIKNSVFPLKVGFSSFDFGNNIQKMLLHGDMYWQRKREREKLRKAGIKKNRNNKEIRIDEERE